MPELPTEFEVRAMTRPELDIALEWAALEGWNPGLSDADAFYATDPGGFLVGLYNGQPVACISAVIYDDLFGFIGFYLVLPEYRRQGYGRQLWDAAVQRLGERNIGLDAVVAQQENYRQSGFTPAYRSVRFSGAGIALEHAGLAPLEAVPFDVLEAYDRRMFPASRKEFLGAWLTMPGTSGCVAVENGAVHGYGLIRPCRVGYKIGPLYANDAATARRILGRLSAAVSGETLSLDVPEINPAAVALAQSVGMTPVFETVRMYTRYAPEVDLQRIFGVTTFELG